MDTGPDGTRNLEEMCWRRPAAIYCKLTTLTPEDGRKESLWNVGH
jgi:hypothetical protein